MSSVVTAAKWLTILYSIYTSRKSHLRSAHDSQPSSFSVWVTLLACLWSFFTFLTALRWTSSSAFLSLHRCGSQTVALYSSTDRTRLKYAISLSFGGAFFRFRRRNQRGLFAFLVIVETWADHCKSFDIITPRYLALLTSCKACPLMVMVYSFYRTAFFLEIRMTSHCCIERHTPPVAQRAS